MYKTTVYLTNDEAAELRRAAATIGKSQSELIREGVRWVVSETPRRVFHSMGVGDGDGSAYQEWDADELYREVMGWTNR